LVRWVSVCRYGGIFSIKGIYFFVRCNRSKRFSLTKLTKYEERKKLF
jgi:hypothetical protein